MTRAAPGCDCGQGRRATRWLGAELRRSATSRPCDEYTKGECGMARYCRTVGLDSDVPVAVRRGVAISLSSKCKHAGDFSRQLLFLSSLRKQNTVSYLVGSCLHTREHAHPYPPASTSNRTNNRHVPRLIGSVQNSQFLHFIHSEEKILFPLETNEENNFFCCEEPSEKENFDSSPTATTNPHVALLFDS
jgi:hypothetical protein